MAAPGCTGVSVAPVGYLLLRRDFLFVAQGQRSHGLYVVLQGRKRKDHKAGVDENARRAGITASKKVGNAVTRNRAKRRLRHALKALLPMHGLPGWDYVVIARSSAPCADWQALLDDLQAQFIRLSREPQRQTAETSAT